MLAYKGNLTVVSQRYNDFERRLFRWFASNPQRNNIFLSGEADTSLHLMNALSDGLVAPTGETGGQMIGGVPVRKAYALTQKGQAFVQRWLAAGDLG